jgi:TatD DNase family protein
MYIDIHSHRDHSTPDIIRVCHCDSDGAMGPSGFYSVGIHPWNVQHVNLDEQLELMKSLVNDDRLLMIGECGLDKTKGADWALQNNAFLHQVELAEMVNKPLIIHCVKSYNEMIDIHRNHHSVPWIFHAFNGKPQLAVQLCKLGFYLSMGQRQLRSPKGQEALRFIALDRLFLETDDTDDDIVESYTLAARVLSMSVPNLIDRIAINFKSVMKTDFPFV